MTKVQEAGPDASARARLARGTRKHHEHGLLVDAQRWVRKAFFWLFAAAIVSGGLYLLAQKFLGL